MKRGGTWFFVLCISYFAFGSSLRGCDKLCKRAKHKVPTPVHRVTLSLMLKGFLGSLFRHTPAPLRRLFSRATNARFSATAGGIVIDDQDRLLLLKHVFRGGSGWGIPGGFIHAGEQPEQALRRELREEVGLELASTELALVRTLKSTQQIEIIFRCRPHGEARPCSVEVEQAEWFSRQALPKDLAEDQRRLIDRVIGDK
jgi:8-oxo-dGTP diphosphatase